MGVGGVGGYRSLPDPEPDPGTLPPLVSPGGIDLFARNAIQSVAAESIDRDRAAAAAAAQAKKLDFSAASGPAVEKTRTQYMGPTYAALAGMRTAPDLTDKLQGQAALAALPAAMLGSLAKPAVDAAYGIVDRVPAALRRPLEKNLGLLIDSALVATSAAGAPLLNVTGGAGPSGGAPDKVQLQAPAYGQMSMACGEVAAATIMKAAGEPVALGDVDTQMVGGGGSLLPEQELRRRGLSFVNGPGTLGSLEAFVASGYPVMVSIARDGKSDHYATVTGYDKQKGTYTIANYDSKGTTVEVPAGKFAKEWEAHKNYMTAVIPKRDPRIEPLIKAGDVRRKDEVGQGFTVNDFYVTNAGKVFVEGAYRYVSDKTDVTVKVNFNNKEEELSRQLGGSLSVRRKIGDDLHVGLKIEKMSLRGTKDEWTSFKTMPVSAYATLEGKGFEIKAGGERGAFQASAAADLGKVLSGMGFRANASVNPDGSYKVMGWLTGTF